MATAPPIRVVILALESIGAPGSVPGEVLAAIRKVAYVEVVSEPRVAAERLTQGPMPHAVVLSDAGITSREHRHLLSHLAEYTRRGGRSIFGIYFPSLITIFQLPKLFGNSFDLHWKVGQYTRNDQVVQSNFNRLPSEGLPPRYSVKALHLAQVAAEDAWYCPPSIEGDPDSDGDEHEVPPRDEQTLLTAVAFASVGEGFVGYLGDVNWEQPTLDVLVCMCTKNLSHKPMTSHPTNVVASGSMSRQASWPKPVVLILSLAKDRIMYNCYSHILSSLRLCATVHLEETLERLKFYLSSPTPPTCILLIDSGAMDRQHRSTLKLIVQFAKNGGRVVAGLNFGNRMNYRRAKQFFKKFGLPWDAGSYLRTTVHLNQSKINGVCFGGVPTSASIRSVHLINVSSGHSIYNPSSGSQIESKVFPPDHFPIDPRESAAAFAPVGRGFFGYTGDVNSEETTTYVIMAMFQLPLSVIGPYTGDISPRGKRQKNIHQMQLIHSNDAPETGNRIYSEAIRQAGHDIETSIKMVLEPESTSNEATTSSHVADPFPPPRPREREVRARAARRAAVSKDKRERGERMKEGGNALFKQGDYQGAVECYLDAIETHGPRPLYQTNLAACYLKLDDYEAASEICSEALLRDPKNVKARFRRGIAFKELGKLSNAIHDFKACLKQSPNQPDGLRELQDAKDKLAASGETYEDHSGDDEGLHPSLDADPDDLVTDSDTSDFHHEGNGIPCRYYNRNGCLKKSQCDYKHAPCKTTIRVAMFAIGIWSIAVNMIPDVIIPILDSTYRKMGGGMTKKRWLV